MFHLMKSKLEFEANLTIDDWVFNQLQYYVSIPILGKIKDEKDVKITVDDTIIKIHHKNETCETKITIPLPRDIIADWKPDKISIFQSMIRISINHVLQDCWIKKVFELCRILNRENLDNWDLKWREFKEICIEDFLEKERIALDETIHLGKDITELIIKKMIMKPWCHGGCKYFLYYVQDAIHRNVEGSPRIMSQILSETDLEKSDILSLCENGFNVIRSNQSNEWTLIHEDMQNNLFCIYTEIVDKFKITKDEILCSKEEIFYGYSHLPLCFD